MQSSNVLSRSTHSQLDLLPLWQQSMPATWSAFQSPLGQSGGEGLSYHWSHWTIWEWKEIKLNKDHSMNLLSLLDTMWESMGIFYWVYIAILCPAASSKSSKSSKIIQVSLSGAQARRLPTRDHQSREHTLLPERCSSALSAEAVGGFFTDRSWCLWDSLTGQISHGFTLLWQSLSRFHCSKTFKNTTTAILRVQDVARCCKRQINKNHGWIFWCEVEILTQSPAGYAIFADLDGSLSGTTGGGHCDMFFSCGVSIGPKYKYVQVVVI